MTSTAPACPLTVVAQWLAGLESNALWWAYLGCGGNRSRTDMADYLHGTALWPDGEHNALSQALNEALWEIGSPDLVPLRQGRGDPHQDLPLVVLGAAPGSTSRVRRHASRSP